MWKDQFVRTNRALHGNRANCAPSLSVPDSLPGLNGLGLAKPVGFRIANSKERVRLALPEPAKLSAFYGDYRRTQVRASRGCRNFGASGARCPFFLRKRVSRRK